MNLLSDLPLRSEPLIKKGILSGERIKGSDLLLCFLPLLIPPVRLTERSDGAGPCLLLSKSLLPDPDSSPQIYHWSSDHQSLSAGVTSASARSLAAVESQRSSVQVGTALWVSDQLLQDVGVTKQ